VFYIIIFMIFRIYLHSNPLHFGYPLSLLLIWSKKGPALGFFLNSCPPRREAINVANFYLIKKSLPFEMK